MSTQERVLVVGGGIAGLVAAFRLRQAGFDVTVLDKAGPATIGGRMGTVEVRGFHVDVGATLLLASYRDMLALAADAGLAGEICPGSDHFSILRNGEAQPIHTRSRRSLARSPLVRGFPVRDLLKVAADYARIRGTFAPDDLSRSAARDIESVAEYGARRGLRRETLEYLLAPLVTGPTLGDPEDSSIVSAHYMFHVMLGGGGTFTSARGVGFLPQGLARQLDVEYGAQVTSVEERDDEVLVTWTRPGEPERVESASACVLAVPPPQLLPIYAQLDDGQRDYLAEVRYAKAVLVAFGLDRPTTEPSVLLQVPRAEDPDIVGYTLAHNLAPERVSGNGGLVVAHFSGTWSAANWDLDDAQAVEQALAATRKLGVLSELAEHTTMTQVSRVAPATIVRRPGEFTAMARFARSLRPDARVRFAGGDYIAQSTTNGSLRSGEKAARALVAFLR